MQKLKKVTNEYLYSAKMDMNVQRRSNLRTIEHFNHLTSMLNLLGIRDESLFRNNFKNQQMHFIQTRKVFHNQGNHFLLG